MAIALNKKKNFSKTADEKSLKAQDETIQITRGEWESMQESLSQLQNFMNDLVEGNLEIEIIDEGEEMAEPEDADMQDIELPEEVEEVEIEEMEEPAEEEMAEEEEKAEDADLNEVLQDPAKRKAVMEFLKATDSRSPFQGITMNAVKKRIGRAVEKTGASLGSRKKAVDSIMKEIWAEKNNGSVIESVIVNKAVDTVLSKIADGYNKEKDMHDGMAYPGKLSYDADMTMEQFIEANVKPGMSDDQVGNMVEKVCEKYDCKVSKAIALVRSAQEGMKLEDAKAKKAIKRKTLTKAEDASIPDFTSRFVEERKAVKSLDKANSKDLSKEFLNRFN